MAATDLCIENGLEIPLLPPELIARIDRILPPYWSRANPLDLVGEADVTIPLKVMEELMRWDGCDACIHLGIMGRTLILQKQYESAKMTDPSADWSSFEQYIQYVRQIEEDYMEKLIRLMETYGKPVLGAYVRQDERDKTTLNVVPESPFKGIVFRTAEHVIHAMAKICSYGEWVARTGRER